MTDLCQQLVAAVQEWFDAQEAFCQEVFNMSWDEFDQETSKAATETNIELDPIMQRQNNSRVNMRKALEAFKVSAES